ncbi:MAG TPA: OmpA family protein [Acetobacteraceae bacterium]|jgi:outer membrane protein OmpA-like peptidoglycan-associated protein|nr:OmpA family protein [Acetobacteraceae bacterium]
MRRIMTLFLFCFLVSQAHAAEPAARNYVVFFLEWSANLDDAAQAVISHAADYAKSHPGVPVHVNAFADPTGSRKANILLTDLRAQIVMDQMQTDGIPEHRLIGRGHGSVQFALTSQESRRVEISIGGH